MITAKGEAWGWKVLVLMANCDCSTYHPRFRIKLSPVRQLMPALFRSEHLKASCTIDGGKECDMPVLNRA